MAIRKSRKNNNRKQTQSERIKATRTRFIKSTTFVQSSTMNHKYHTLLISFRIQHNRYDMMIYFVMCVIHRVFSVRWSCQCNSNIFVFYFYIKLLSFSIWLISDLFLVIYSRLMITIKERTLVWSGAFMVRCQLPLQCAFNLSFWHFFFFCIFLSENRCLFSFRFVTKIEKINN